MQQSIEQVYKLLQACNAEAVLFSSPITISYLTGYHGFTDMEREGYLLITENKSFLLATSLRAAETKGIKGIQTIAMHGTNTFEQILKTIISEENIQTLCIEENNLTVSEYNVLQRTIKNIKDFPIRNLRVIKTDNEIAHIQKACDIANQALTILKPFIKPGITEKEVAEKLENEIRKQKADIAFPTIVAFGKNAAIPHHATDSTKLKTNDLILIDFGAKWQGYCSDMTRTFFIGKPTAEQKKVYDVVADAQQAAITFLTSYFSLHTSKQKGIKASDIDKAARDYIISKGYPSIPHSLGHGIGLAVHESPSLSPSSQDILKEGMVFSIEPGIYLEGNLGVRIEDLFVLNKGKLTSLTF